MLNRFISCLLVIIITQLTLGCGSTTLLMKDHRQLKGTVVSSDATHVKIVAPGDDAVMKVPRSDIYDVEYSGSSAEVWGIGLTAGGAITSGIGVALLVDADGCSTCGWGSALIGAFLFVAGAPLVLTGVPLWVAGAVRKNDQRKLYEFDAKTGMFDTPTQIGTYNLTLRF